MTHHLWVIMWLIFWTFHKLFCHGFFLNIFFRCFHFNNVYFRFDIKHFRFWRFWIHGRSFWFVEFFDCRWLAISFYFHCIHKGAGQSGRGWSRLGYAEKYYYVIVTLLRFRAFVSKFAEIVIFFDEQNDILNLPFMMLSEHFMHSSNINTRNWWRQRGRNWGRSKSKWIRIQATRIQVYYQIWFTRKIENFKNFWDFRDVKLKIALFWVNI